MLKVIPRVITFLGERGSASTCDIINLVFNDLASDHGMILILFKIYGMVRDFFLSFSYFRKIIPFWIYSNIVISFHIPGLFLCSVLEPIGKIIWTWIGDSFQRYLWSLILSVVARNLFRRTHSSLIISEDYLQLSTVVP